MNSADRPNHDPHRPLSDAEMDRLLSECLQAELPAQWPTASSILDRAAPRHSVRHTSALTTSRLALAASVTIFIGTCWFLSQSVITPTGNRPQPSGLIGGAEATVPADLLPMTERVPMLAPLPDEVHP